MSPLDVVLTSVVGAIFGFHLAQGKVKRYWKLLKCLTPLQWLTGFLGAACVLAVVVGVGSLIFTYSPAWVNWSWLMLFGKSEGSNVVTAPFRVPYVAWAFWIAFVILVPKLAYNEEKQYRSGHQTPATVAKRSLRFGLVHWFVGVPLSFCLALSLGGVWFAYQAKRGGVRRATAYHAMHNWLILIVVGVMLALAGHI